MSNTPPTDKTPEVNAGNKVFTKNRVVLGLLLLAHAVFGAYCTPTNETLVDLKLGVMISQPVLLAIWGAFTQHRFYYRLLWSLFICTYLSFADDLGVVQQMGDNKPGETIVLNLALFVASLPILLLVRRLSRWRITDSEAIEAESPYLASHYGIRHLMILTAIVALACGLVRTLLIIGDSGFPYSSVVVFIIVLGVRLVVVFPVGVVPWIVVARGRKLYSLALATILVAIALNLFAFFILEAINSSQSHFFFDPVVYPCLSNQIGAIVSAIGTTLVMRYCGVRMIREPMIAMK